MYTPEHFRMSEADIRAFLDRAGAGTLVSVDPSTMTPMASHLPWVLSSEWTLTSHMGRVNEQASHGGRVLVVFMGDEAYVSEAWMKDGSVPSWNYETVHVSGELTIHDDPRWVKDSWADLMARHSGKPMTDYDDEWLDRQARACVGVEVTISSIQGKSKLSQNRSDDEVRSIADHLMDSCPALAQRMRDVSLSHIESRQARIDAAKPYSL